VESACLPFSRLARALQPDEPFFSFQIPRKSFQPSPQAIVETFRQYPRDTVFNSPLDIRLFRSLITTRPDQDQSSPMAELAKGRRIQAGAPIKELVDCAVIDPCFCANYLR